MNRSPRWWARWVFHNCVAHPLIPIASFLDEYVKTSFTNRIGDVIYRMHDESIAVAEEPNQFDETRYPNLVYKNGKLVD